MLSYVISGAAALMLSSSSQHGAHLHNINVVQDQTASC